MRLRRDLACLQCSKQEGRSNKQTLEDLVHICKSFSALPCSALQATDHTHFLRGGELNFTQQTLNSKAFELCHIHRRLLSWGTDCFFLHCNLPELQTYVRQTHPPQTALLVWSYVFITYNKVTGLDAETMYFELEILINKKKPDINYTIWSKPNSCWIHVSYRNFREKEATYWNTQGPKMVARFSIGMWLDWLWEATLDRKWER